MSSLGCPGWLCWPLKSFGCPAGGGQSRGASPRTFPLCSMLSLTLQWASPGVFTWQQCYKKARMFLQGLLKPTFKTHTSISFHWSEEVTGLPRFKRWRNTFFLFLGGSFKEFFPSLSINHNCKPCEYRDCITLCTLLSSLTRSKPKYFLNEWLSQWREESIQGAFQYVLVLNIDILLLYH